MFGTWKSLFDEDACVKNLLDENTTEFGLSSHETAYVLTNMENQYVQRYDQEVQKFNEAVRKITEAVILPEKNESWQ